MNRNDADQRGQEKSKVPVAERAAESPIDGMYNFAHKSFYVETMKGYTFVLYMQGAGRDSEKAEITWKKINCAKEQLVCKEQGILGFPMVKYYHEGNEIESHYISDNVEDLISYVKKKLEQPPPEVKDNVQKLTSETIKDVLRAGVIFLRFDHPHCGFCKRMDRAWKQLSNEDFSGIAGPVVIAELDCKEYQTAGIEYGCRGFPTMRLFVDGEGIAYYTAQRTAKSLKEFVLQLLNGYRPKDDHRSSSSLNVCTMDKPTDFTSIENT